MPSIRKDRFFLYGYYGQGNLGDDLLLRATIDGIRDIIPHARFLVRNEGDVKGFDSSGTSVVFTGVDKILSDQTKTKWQRGYEVLAAYRRYFRQCDWFIFGGGTVFHERKSILPLALLLATCLLARASGLHIAALGVGVAEMKSGSGRAILNMIIRLSDLFAVRDDAALAECRKGGAANRVTLTGDLVFTLAPLLQGKDFEQNAHSAGQHLGLTVYPPVLTEGKAGKFAFEAIQRTISSLIARGWQISLLVFHEDLDHPALVRDRAVLTRLKEGLPSSQQSASSIAVVSGDNEECRQLFSSLDVICGMRFHGHVLAAIYDVPFVGISVDNKIDAICRSFGMPLLSLSELKGDALGDAVERAAFLQIDPVLREACMTGAKRNFSELMQCLAPKVRGQDKESAANRSAA